MCFIQFSRCYDHDYVLRDERVFWMFHMRVSKIIDPLNVSARAAAAYTHARARAADHCVYSC